MISVSIECIMTEKENIGANEETYRITPDIPEISEILFNGPDGAISFGRRKNDHVECMVKRFHWLVGSPGGNRYDIELVNGSGLTELDQLQTSFSAYPSDYSFGFEADIKSLRRRTEYRYVKGILPAGDIEAAIAEDPRSGVVPLGNAFRNSLTAIACKEPECLLKGSVLRKLTSSGIISRKEADAVSAVLDYADIAMHLIRFDLPDKETMSWWLSIYGKVATAAVLDRMLINRFE